MPFVWYSASRKIPKLLSIIQSITTPQKSLFATDRQQQRFELIYTENMKCLISFSSLMMLLEPLRSKAYLHICPLHFYQTIKFIIVKGGTDKQNILSTHFPLAFLFVLNGNYPSLKKKNVFFLLLLNKLDFKRVQINKWNRSWGKSMLHSIMAFSENSQEN